MIDLKKLSNDDLTKLKSNVDAEIKRRQRKEKEQAKRQIVELSQKHRIKLGKLAEETKIYVNPENPWETWLGKGRKPKWVISALESGKELSDLELK